MTRWLVTGGRGMLATELAAVLREAGEEVAAPGRDELDIRDPGELLDDLKPDVVVNCAAWTAVDDAEVSETEALAVNGRGPRVLAEHCARTGARLLQLSTDYVFDGRGSRPHAENDPTAPLNAYGRTKLAGERAVLELLPETGYIVRTAWLYGVAGPNFVRTMIRLAAERDHVEVVDDQHGQPTWARDVAEHLVALVTAGAAPGIYHATNSGSTTWYGLAREVFALLGADPERVRPVPGSAYPRRAVRPRNSVLGHDRWTSAGLRPPRDWQAALRAAWPQLSGPSAADRS